jgi:hypothetical protein
MVTNLEDGATDDISGTGNSLGVEVFDTEVTAVELGRRQGVHGLDFTALSKETFDLGNNWCSLELLEVRVSVVVDSDDELSFEVANVTWVVTLICSNASWGHGEDTSVRRQFGSNVPCFLRITNVREGDGEEAITNDLRSIDGLERGVILELATVSVRNSEVVMWKRYLEGFGNATRAEVRRDANDCKSTDGVLVGTEDTFGEMNIVDVLARCIHHEIHVTDVPYSQTIEVRVDVCIKSAANWLDVGSGITSLQDRSLHVSQGFRFAVWNAVLK